MRQASARLAGSWDDTAGGNWLKAFLMSAQLHF